MTFENPKGTRDVLPEDKILRDGIVAVLKEVFEKYGYNPLETPALENYETLASKYAGGAEILKEVYELEDNGGRKLGLRYDLTVPFARVIAMNPSIKKPFKRYQIDRVWRDGPIKLGRYREFWQCDVDVVGIASVLADAEFLALASEVFQRLGLDVVIKVNNRKLMNALLDAASIEKQQQETALLALDKLAKIGTEGVRKELEEKGIPEKSASQLLKLFTSRDESSEKMLKRYERVVKDGNGLAEVKDLLAACADFGVRNVRLEPSLARGLAYYTGSVFEVFLKEGTITSSLAGGGRYDRMIGNFIGSKEEVPAAGISFGLDVIAEALMIQEKMQKKKSVVEAYVIPIQTTSACIRILAEMRANGVRADMDFSGKGVTKNLDYANKYGIPYVLIIGEREIEAKKVKLRDMHSGEEKLVTLEQAILEIGKRRR